MKNSFAFGTFIVVVLVFSFQIQVHATPAGEFVLSSSSFSICLVDGSVEISFNSPFILPKLCWHGWLWSCLLWFLEWMLYFRSDLALVDVFGDVLFFLSGPLIKHLSSLVKWTRSSYRAPPSGGCEKTLSVFLVLTGYLCLLWLLNFLFHVMWASVWQMGMSCSLRMGTWLRL